MATANNNIDHRRQEVQQIVKNACDQLNAEGVDARNYVEQLAWLFFLKAFDETEARKEQEAAFDDKPYERRLAGEYAWSQWAKNTDRADEMLESTLMTEANTNIARISFLIILSFSSSVTRSPPSHHFANLSAFYFS